MTQLNVGGGSTMSGQQQQQRTGASANGGGGAECTDEPVGIINHEMSNRAAQKIHDALRARPKLILGFWILSMLVCGYFSSYFLDKAEDRLTPPYQSRVGKLNGLE